MYYVPETNLFAEGPIIPKERELLAIRQRSSRSGYTTATLPSHTNSSLSMSHSQYHQRSNTIPTSQRNRAQSSGNSDPNVAEEIRRMKSNFFMEAKNIMYVYDEILQNAMEQDDIESNFNKMMSQCSSETSFGCLRKG